MPDAAGTRAPMVNFYSLWDPKDGSKAMGGNRTGGVPGLAAASPHAQAQPQSDFRYSARSATSCTLRPSDCRVL